jgi:16S rRNA (uracil1498-N3)-methyltransferase
MQLFHIYADKVRVKWNNIELFSVPELLFQLRKVLRIKKWDKICIQYSNNEWTIRYELSIQNWTDKDLTGEIISSQIFSFPEKNVSMIIAMPNKREKAELITQKLTEIWVENIYFWVSEHSIIRQRNDKKAERLDKISHEAIEQSRGIQLPEIKFLKSEKELKDFVNWKNVIIANMNWLHHWELSKSESNDLCGVIWPEGWFSHKDLEFFDNAKIIDLWENVLRMETASIVLWRILKNM